LWYCIDESSLPIKQFPNPPHHLIDTLNNKHSHVITMSKAYFCLDVFLAMFEPMNHISALFENTDLQILQNHYYLWPYDGNDDLAMINIVLKEQKGSMYAQSLHAAFAQCCIDKLLSDPQ
jgi:hypothetical protein